MKINYDGLQIIGSQEELDSILGLTCDCGHSLRNHDYFSLTKWDTGDGTIQVTTKGCRICGKHGDTFICDQFRA
jgi:hypothetical protein